MANKGSKGSKKRRLSTDEDEEEHIPSKKTPASKQQGPNGMRSPSFSFTPQNKPAELYRKDLISAMKLADSEQLQNDDYLLISDPWRQDWERGVQVPVNDLAIINEPKVKEITEKSKTGDFKIPRKFLHAVQDESYRQGCHELTGMNQLSEQVVRYDLDDLDVCWLETVNMEREEMSLSLVHEWIMERVMEELENQCHKGMSNIIKSEEGFGIEYDEDVVCDVCRSPDSEDGNEMVFCDNCDICVHQACYGIQTIPEGSYLCRACALGVKPTCLLCPNLKGAMKSTRSGTKWAHVSCSLWIPEVSIGCVEKMEPITKISLIPASRWTLVCCLCKERAGACIQCSVKTCKTAFHVTCGFNNNMDMKTILDAAEKDGVKLRAYCPKHTNNGGQSGDESPPKSPRSPKSPKSPRSPRSPRKDGRKEMSKEEVSALRAKKTKEIEEHFSSFVNVTEVAETLQVDVDIVDIVMIYWKLKRMANFHRPLLMPKTEEADRLEKQQEDSLVARMKMFVQLRQDLERVRNLCYMVNRREKMKRQFLKMQERVFTAANVYMTDPKVNLSSRDVLKTVKKYRDFNVYLATNVNPLPNLPPLLTTCHDLDSITTDDEKSDHSGPTYSSKRVVRKLSGLEKLEKDHLPSVSVKTEMSDNDVDIEADEPPVLEMEDIGARRGDSAKESSSSIKGEIETRHANVPDPMPNLQPELSRSSRIVRTKVEKMPKSNSNTEVVLNSSVQVEEVHPVRSKIVDKKLKPPTLKNEVSDMVLKMNKSISDPEETSKINFKFVDRKSKASTSKSSLELVSKLFEFESSSDSEETASRVKSSKYVSSSTKKQTDLKPQKEEVVTKTKSEINIESANVSLEKTRSPSPVKSTTPKVKSYDRVGMPKRQSNRVKQELFGLLTKPNLRIDQEVKDRVQNRILKSRGKLKRINGIHDDVQPKIDAYFEQCTTSASGLRSRSSSRLERNLATPPKKALVSNSGGSVSVPKGSLSASKKSEFSPLRSRKSSPLQIKMDSGNKIDVDLYSLMHSPETRSFKRRIESGFESAVKKNIFKASTKLTPSENYSAIPMLIAPDCLSIKQSLKETIKNSRMYRSPSPLSSDSSHCDSKEETPRCMTRSQQLDNDENSRDSNSSVRSSTRLKFTNSVIKAPNFKA